MRAIGVFGGTFDPVHKGHMQMALAAQSYLSLDEVRLIPCHLPPHRDNPHLSSRERLHLLSLACAEYERLVVDDRELQRQSPSWTVDTLKELRADLGHTVSITLLMGADAFSQLTTWHQWQKLPELAHIGVFLRPGYDLPCDGVLRQWLDEFSSDQQALQGIHSQPWGCVVALNQPQIDLSATRIRQQLSAGVVPDGLPPLVEDYIVENRLYGLTKKSS